MENMYVLEAKSVALRGQILKAKESLKNFVVVGNKWKAQLKAVKWGIGNVQDQLVVLSTLPILQDASIVEYKTALDAQRQELKILMSQFEKNQIILVPKALQLLFHLGMQIRVSWPLWIAFRGSPSDYKVFE